MDLKAKLEAVIYAAEEPVTLGQLAVLFADEALTLKAEQEAARAAQIDAEAAESEPLLAGLEPGLEPDRTEPAPPESTATLDAEAEGTLAISIEIPARSPAAPLSEAGSDPNPDTDFDSAASDDPVAGARREARQRDREIRGVLRQLLDELIESFASDSRGIEIREIAGGYRMATKPACHDAVRAFVKSLKPALKLSLPALETLAVIAYKQPVTAPEVNEIRGVDSSGVFGSLLARKLIATAGRKQVIGRPILYKTTREFLLRFGLKDVTELPSMEEFEKMAVELEEAEAIEDAAGQEPTAPEDTQEAIASDLGLELTQPVENQTGDIIDDETDDESDSIPEPAPNKETIH
jgi:segregation and condensation protein B